MNVDNLDDFIQSLTELDKELDARHELRHCEFLLVHEAARLLGVTPWARYQLCARGEVPTVRFGRRTMIPRSFIGEVTP